MSGARPRIAFVFPICEEGVNRSHPAAREDSDRFDLEYICHKNAMHHLYPAGVRRLGAEATLYYVTARKVPVKRFRHAAGHELVRCPLWRRPNSFGRALSPALLREIRRDRERIDLVHHFTTYGGSRWPLDPVDWMAAQCRLLGIPIVGHYRTGRLSRTWRARLSGQPWFKIRTLRSLQRILSVNLVEIARLLDPSHPEYYGVHFDPQQVVHVPNSVDPEVFHPGTGSPEENYRQACEAVGFRPDRRRILHVGRFVPVKAHDLLLGCFTELAGKFPELDLVLCGDGPLLEQVRREIQRLGLTDRVEMRGWVFHQELVKLMRASHIHVLPSHSETYASTPLEAAATGLYSVITRVNPDIEAIMELGVGELVDIGDAAGLLRALEASLQRRAVVPEKVRREFLDRYSTDVICRRLLQVYQEVLEER